MSRQWLVEVERGRSRAEVGLIARVFNALGMPLQSGLMPYPSGVADAPDIDAIIDAARRPR